jgi:hypothetical protein
MKLILLTRYSPQGASSRLPFLQRADIECTVQPLFSDAKISKKDHQYGQIHHRRYVARQETVKDITEDIKVFSITDKGNRLGSGSCLSPLLNDCSTKKTTGRMKCLASTIED